MSDKLDKKTFKAGIHTPDNKGLSCHAGIETMPAPKVLYISLKQHLGAPAVSCVAKGDKVKSGQIIAKADGAVSSDIFSPVSGTVTDIAERETSSGHGQHIIIENDGADDTFTFPALDKPNSEQIRARIKECGIVGMGGAGFPTSLKLTTTEKINTMIINGAECEPYITSDHRIMLDYTEQLVRGADYLARAVSASECVIAIEENKPDAIERVSTFLKNNPSFNMRVEVLKCKYPQGAEKQLIYAVTKQKVPVGKYPASVGVIVNNVHTALSVYLAVTNGQTLYKRIMTVSGGGIKKPSNIWVRTGTAFKDVIEYCGGLSEKETVKMLDGGPMMGVAVDSDEISTTKTTSCLLLLTKDEAFTGESQQCINCARCAKACPMRLMPMYIDAFSQGGDIETAVKYGARNCIECGCCAYVCPAKRPLVQSIRIAKKRDKARGGK